MTVAGKQLTAAYYGSKIQRAYFGGCSNGGRMALMEAQRYPDDYDGIISGAPFLDMGVAPDRMVAIKFQGRRTGAVLRTMPLCKFPEQARYQGSGDVNDGANWRCAAQPGLLESGPVGKTAGLEVATAGRRRKTRPAAPVEVQERQTTSHLAMRTRTP